MAPRHGILARATMLLAAGGVLLAGCANPTDPMTGDPSRFPAQPVVERDEALAATVPASTREAGRIVVAMNSGIPPIKFRDSNGEVAGFNPQLIQAAAALLGLEVEYVEVPFDALIPGLESRRFDVFASAGDFVERRERTDFIDYLNYGAALMAQTSFEKDALTEAELCGHSVAFTRGAAQQSLVEAADANCIAQGAPAITQVPLKDANAVVLAVQSGQAELAWGDSPALMYRQKLEPDAYKIVHNELKGPYGIGILRENGELRDALQAALQELARRGIYQQLITDWKLDVADGLPGFPLNTGPAQK